MALLLPNAYRLTPDDVRQGEIVATATATVNRTRVATPPRQPTLLNQIWKNRADYLYVLPALLAMGVVIVYPFIRMVILSFQYTSPYGGETRFVGFDNYVEAFQDEQFGRVVFQTIIWTVVSTVIAMILGIAAAIVVSRPLVGRSFIRGALFIPYVIGPVTAAFLWKWMFHADFGVISGTLIQFGLLREPIKFIDSTELVLGSVIAANVWKEFSFAMIMVLAGLQAIPEQLYSAAKVDGAGRWRRFTDVTLPQLMPVIIVTSILLIIANINSFTIVWVLTGGGPANASNIFIVFLYTKAFVGSPNFEIAAALGVIVFLFLMVFAVIYVWLLSRQAKSRHAAAALDDEDTALAGLTANAGSSIGGTK